MNKIAIILPSKCKIWFIKLHNNFAMSLTQTTDKLYVKNSNIDDISQLDFPKVETFEQMPNC